MSFVFISFVTFCLQLFVKNIPLNRSMEDVKGMFEQFGTVIGMVPVPSRKNVVYMVRDQQNHKHTCIEFCVFCSIWILRVQSKLLMVFTGRQWPSSANQ